MNCAVYSGRISNDPELRVTKAGDKIVSFELSVHRPLTRDVYDIIDCVAWNENAEFVMRNFKKGSVVEVRGVTTTRIKERNGISAKDTELRVDEASFGRSASRQ